MRATILTSLLLLSAVASLVPPAAAQLSSAMTIMLSPAEEALDGTGPVLMYGTATLTMDATAYAQYTQGVPVSYTVTRQPAWATIVVTPSSDLFPMPATPPTGFAVQMTRSFIVLATAGELESDLTDAVEIMAVSAPGTARPSAIGTGSTLLVYDAPEKDHDDDCNLTAEQKTALIAAGDDLYEQWQAEQAEDQASSEDDVSVQNTGATLMPAPWVAVAAFGLVGAGLGLALRRKLRP